MYPLAGQLKWLPMKPVEAVAQIALALELLVPLFWVPFYLWPGLRKRLGLFYYLLVPGLWLILIQHLLSVRFYTRLGSFPLPHSFRVLGLFLLSGGILLEGITFLYLRGQIVGRHHFQPRSGRLVTRGPFRLVRHPTYLGHTLFFLGASLFSGYRVVALLALLDLLLLRWVIIPREERELEELYGRAYEDYRRRTPCLLPRLRKR